MQISKRSLEKFKEMYLKRFGEKLSDEDVLRKAQSLLMLYRAVYGDTSSKHDVISLELKGEDEV